MVFLGFNGHTGGAFGDGIFIPKCMSSVSNGVEVTAFKKSLKYFFHLPRMSFSLLSKTLFWSSMDQATLYFLTRRRQKTLTRMKKLF